MNNNQEEVLGAFLKRILDERGISNNMLAQTVGISEGSVRNLLRYGVDPKAPAPQPHTLRAIAEYLELDEIEIFQRAGYLSEGAGQTRGNAIAEHFWSRVEALPQDKQQVMWDLLASLERSCGIRPPDVATRDLLREVRQLQREHPMFEERKFSFVGEVGRKLGNLTRTSTPTVFTENVLERVNGQANVTEEDLQRVLEHPNARVILGALMPRTDIPELLEKLYWLTHPDRTLDKAIFRLPQEQQDGIAALWHLLEQVTANTP